MCCCAPLVVDQLDVRTPFSSTSMQMNFMRQLFLDLPNTQRWLFFFCTTVEEVIRTVFHFRKIIRSWQEWKDYALRSNVEANISHAYSYRHDIMLPHDFAPTASSATSPGSSRRLWVAEKRQSIMLTNRKDSRFHISLINFTCPPVHGLLLTLDDHGWDFGSRYVYCM